MKCGMVNEKIRVLESSVDVWKIMTDIVETGLQEEAFYVCDLGDIIHKYREWRIKMPRIEPHYAVKCNDAQIVSEVLSVLGCSFDCASKGEINKIMELGVDPERIIFANPCKPISHIRHAANLGVQMMTFDNETELHKVKSIYPQAKLVLRIRCEAAMAQCPLGMKFGCDPIKEAPRLIEMAHVLGLEVIGISFHVGSGCRDPPVFRRAIAAARGLFDFAETVGYRFSLLDIGGGFPGNKGTSIDKIAEIVNDALDEMFPVDCGVHIIAEPGRYMVASSFTLATNIHSKRSVVAADSDSGVHHMYYINDGVYGSFNSILYDHAVVTPQPLKTSPHAKVTPSSVWGPTCDGLDQVCDNVLLPEMTLGEWMVFENMGAYTLPVASPFNGFPVPGVHVVASEDTCMLLRNTVTFHDDDFAMEVSLPHLMSETLSLAHTGSPVFELVALH